MSASTCCGRTTLLQRVPYFTTVSGALAAAHAIATAIAAGDQPKATAPQDYHRDAAGDGTRAQPERVGYR